ncbi:hypothetical protein TNCV_2432581 [Trichonephila clavipes]|nr:hypothetical protein TNCV_2432581 [Trichonephila clavipes]
MRKTVEINDYKFDALIDTGITVTLVRYSVYANLGMPTLNPTKIKLSAFGKDSDNQFHLQHVPSKLHSQIIHMTPCQYGGYVPRLVTEWVQLRAFRCSQLTFRMTDCEVDGATASPPQVTSKGIKGGRREAEKRLRTQERQTHNGRAIKSLKK